MLLQTINLPSPKKPKTKKPHQNPKPRKLMTFKHNTILIHLQKMFSSKCILEKQMKYSQDSIKNAFGEECPK